MIRRCTIALLQAPTWRVVRPLYIFLFVLKYKTGGESSLAPTFLGRLIV